MSRWFLKPELVQQIKIQNVPVWGDYSLGDMAL